MERVYVAELLGILINSELFWKAQIENTKNKLCSSFAVLNPIHTDIFYKLFIYRVGS